MSKVQYFFLMLKQGIKGVFRFKAQFTIILILSFLATFILSLSVSTGRRIQDSYDQIVKKVDPFTYETQINVGITSEGGESSANGIMPLNSIINNDFATTYRDAKEPTKGSTRFNFILANPNSYNTAQKAIDSKHQAIVTDHSNFISKSYNRFDFIQAFIAEPNSDDQKAITERWNTLRWILFSTLINDLERISKDQLIDGENLRYSPIGDFTWKNAYWYEKFVKLDPQTKLYGLADWVDDLDQRKDYLDTDNKHQFEYFFYLLSAVDSVLAFFENVKNDLAPYIEKEYHTPITNVQLYALIFGTLPTSDAVNINQNWLVKEDKSNLYSLWLETDKPKSNYTFLNQPGDIADSNDVDFLALIAKNGLRGVTSPMIDLAVDEPTNWSRLQPVQYTKWLTTSKGSNIFRSIGSVFVNPYLYETALLTNFDTSLLQNFEKLTNTEKALFYPYIFTTLLTSHRLASEMFNYDFNIRREATYFHATTQTSYRGIALSKHENYNFTLLKGRNLLDGEYPGEVILSEQFARIQKIPLGGIISVGNANLLVSGFGTDAFSFVPSQDALNPLPNPKVSSFVYGSADALSRIFDETSSNGSAYDSATQLLNFIYWDKGKKVTSKDRLQGYYAALNPSPTNLNTNETIVHQLVDQKKLGSLTADPGEYSLVPFKDSNYRYSWTMAPLLVKAFLGVTSIASAIIILIVLASLIICVKKTIQFNAKQIGILKAMGSSPTQISISYISYGIIISIFAIPVGWIIGNVMQIPFANMVQTYFSIFPDILFFDWISIVVTLIFIGLFAALIGFLSAFFLTNTSVMKILANPIKWHNSKFFSWLNIKVLRNAKFKVRFSLVLSSAGSRQIWLMSGVLLITSILVTASLVIPSVAETSNRLFYRSVHYANEYEDNPLTINAPLSKGTISYWEGHDALERDYENDHRVKLDNSENDYGYYYHPQSYFSTISNGMALPEYLFQEQNDKNGQESFENTFLHLARTNNAGLLSILADIFGNNFYNNAGVGFSIGMIDSLYGVVLHSLDSLNNNSGASNQWTDVQKLRYAQNFSSWLTSSIPQIIKAITNGSGGASVGDGEENSGATWKEQIMGVLYSNLPSYVKSFVQKTDSRLDQYAISYQNQLYIPGEETLTTSINGTVSGKLIKDPYLTLTGLDRNQSAFELPNKDLDKVYLNERTLNQISRALNEPDFRENIIVNGKRIYDANTNTLTIPVLPNKQAESHYHFNKHKVVNDFKHETQKIQFFANLDDGNEAHYIDLPQGAWIYDDTSYANFQKTDSNFELPDYEVDQANNKYYLNPYVLDNNKFSFKSEYQLDDQSQDTTKLVDGAFLFKDFKVSNNQVTSIYTRPYYQYKDLKLFLPMKYITDVNKTLYPGTNHGLHPEEKNDSWYKIVDQKQVPQSVKRAWNQVDSEQYLVINPYDLNYYDPGYNKEIQDNNQALNNLFNKTTFWYRYANEGGAEATLALATTPQTYANKDIKINLEAVDFLKSYNSNLVVVDSNLANMLMKVPTTRHFQYNYTLFDENGLIPAGTPDSNNYVSAFDRYSTKNERFSELNAGSSLWKPLFAKYGKNQTAETFAPHRWYTGKLSNIEEPLTYSTSVSYMGSGRIGLYAIGLGSWNSVSIVQQTATSVLLSESRALISQITGLAISIGSLLLVAIIVTASLLVMLVSDIYIAQYRQFMVLMKALGYSNTAIMGYTLGTASIFALVMLAAGHALGWIVIASVIAGLDVVGFAIPFGFNWWVIPAFALIMVFSYVVSLAVSSAGVRHDPPSKVLAQTSE